LVVGSNQQSAISNQQSAISNQQSAISNQQSAISQYSVVNGQLLGPAFAGIGILMLNTN
jgi:hypothetical protein